MFTASYSLETLKTALGDFITEFPFSDRDLYFYRFVCRHRLQYGLR
jgi:hypothetical protein|nr:MAG TPA: hypothetical protein [Caudoviricetes sp.]